MRGDFSWFLETVLSLRSWCFNVFQDERLISEDQLKYQRRNKLKSLHSDIWIKKLWLCSFYPNVPNFQKKLQRKCESFCIRPLLWIKEPNLMEICQVAALMWGKSQYGKYKYKWQWCEQRVQLRSWCGFNEPEENKDHRHDDTEPPQNHTEHHAA